uniref:RNA helicase n=1 Tax=Daucus carota subsp. sativus TaxID=79200 RepID=A0A164YBP9_DAUCS
MTHATKAIYKLLLTDYVKVSKVYVEDMLFDEQDILRSMEIIERPGVHPGDGSGGKARQGDGKGKPGASNGIRVSAVYGGMSKLEQFKELKAGCEIVVATPGRLIDLLKMKALTMSEHLTWFLMRLIECLTLDMSRRLGKVGMANEDITQVVHVVSADGEKIPWLLKKLPGLIANGDVLVFASKKVTVDMLETQLAEKGFKVAALHGDKDQASHTVPLQKFKSGVYHVLIATDVASCGLDIKSIKSVKEARFAGDLANSLVAAGQDLPVELMDLAMKDGKFSSKRDARKAESKSAPSHVVHGRSAAVNSLKTGMMAPLMQG